MNYEVANQFYLRYFVYLKLRSWLLLLLTASTWTAIISKLKIFVNIMNSLHIHWKDINSCTLVVYSDWENWANIIITMQFIGNLDTSGNYALEREVSYEIQEAKETKGRVAWGLQLPNHHPVKTKKMKKLSGSATCNVWSNALTSRWDWGVVNMGHICLSHINMSPDIFIWTSCVHKY